MIDHLLTAASYLLDHWPVIVAYLGGGSAIAVLVQSIKRKWKIDEQLKFWLIDAKKFLFLLPALFSALFAIAEAIIQNGAVIAQWVPQAAHVMPVLMLIALAIHRFAISDTGKRIEALFTDVRKYRSSRQVVPPVDPLPPASFE